VEEFAGKPGVIGFMVTSARNKPVHHNDYMRLYATLQERGLPIAFHGGYSWQEPAMAQFNRFIGVHTMGFVFWIMVHLINWVVNGLPERFPGLKVLWLESGLAWIPFLMQRLDNEYMMRTSEAPMLKRRPSEYMREMFYASQPLEADNLEALELTFKMINAETQLMYASDWPHWDFDLPSAIFDLPFLSERARRNIMGETAMKLFGLDRPGGRKVFEGP
jgi:predicted TIM-barrel fold metal-dependent hydrolase